MAKFEIDGKEFELEGIESDTIVIVRPYKQVSRDELKNLARSIDNLRSVFARYGITPIVADKDDVTFEVLKAKE